jgi:hypothetical protein
MRYQRALPPYLLLMLRVTLEIADEAAAAASQKAATGLQTS